jgi:hypothetical protein
MPEGFKKRFVRERAKALAVVFLTRRDDLTITDAQKESGLDFLVSIAHDGEPSTRVFGVHVNATMEPVTIDHANKVLKPTMAANQRLTHPLYPVCLFFFTMREEQAFSTWLVEPVVTATGRPKLIVHDTAACKELDNRTINEIVSRVNDWYDVLTTELIA